MQRRTTAPRVRAGWRCGAPSRAARRAAQASWEPSDSGRSSVLRTARHDLSRWRVRPAVIRRRRGELPLEAMGTFPDAIRGPGAGRLHALPDDVREQQLRETETEAADRRNHVPVGELSG